MIEGAEAVRSFWFGALDARGLPAQATSRRWFQRSDDFDQEIRRRFGSAVERALTGEFGDWAAAPGGCLALVILLDQFTRNLYRGDARSFAGDARALDLASAAVDAGDDARLLPVERYFLYMPFEHAEDAAAQRRSVELFAELARAVPSDQTSLFTDALQWAERHRDAIERFGRFPSRNPVLGRESTPEERDFLAEHPSGF